MKNREKRLVIMMAVLLALSGCGGGQTGSSPQPAETDKKAEADKEEVSDDAAESDNPVTIRLGYLPESGTFEDQVAQSFKEYVEEESGGSITVNLFPGGQLGGETEMTEQVKMGTTEMLMVGELTAIDVVPEYATVLRVPYLFDSIEHIERFLEEPMEDVGKTIPELVRERAGIRTLGYYSRGSRQLTSNKPVHSVKDLYNLKLRVPTVAISIECWKETGAVPTAVEAGELYMALQQGLVEAEENPVDFIKGKSLNEVQKYLIKTNHQYGMRWLMINDAFFDGLSERQKEILLEGGRQYTEQGNELIAKTETETEEELAALGMEIIETEEIDIDSIKETILSKLDTIGADWNPSAVKAVEATR